jgi:hypothetical protein
VHDHRNEQYHGGKKGTPEKNVLGIVRKSALWIFSLLFEDSEVEQRLAQEIKDASAPVPPKRDPKFDRAIDDEYGMVDVCDQTYYASELLFSVDHSAYREVGARLLSGDHPSKGKEDE